MDDLKNTEARFCLALVNLGAKIDTENSKRELAESWQALAESGEWPGVLTMTTGEIAYKIAKKHGLETMARAFAGKVKK